MYSRRPTASTSVTSSSLAAALKKKKQQKTEADAANRLRLDWYLQKQDFTGALTLLRLLDRDDSLPVTFPMSAASPSSSSRDASSSGSAEKLSKIAQRTWWASYCHFQRGDYALALDHVDHLLQSARMPSDHDDQDEAMAGHIETWRLSRACCLYYLARFEEAEQEALLTKRLPLSHRLLYLLAHRRAHGDQVLRDRAERLSADDTADQVAMAHVSFLAREFQTAVEIYKRVLQVDRGTDVATSMASPLTVEALQVYLAMCYFQLDYYDVSLELLAVYLENHGDSFVACNLRACNQYRLYSGHEATQELTQFCSRYPTHPCTQAVEDAMGIHSVYTHNRAIFQASMLAEAMASPSTTTTSAAASLASLATLVDQLPEARMNLVLAHLQQREYRHAFEMLEDVKPSTTVEHIAKAVVHAVIGEQSHSSDHVFLAETYFHAVGANPQECDTIPGRQCMASYFLLRKEYSDANVYLSSIAQYLVSSDAFNWNYGLSLAAAGDFAEAEDVLLRVQHPRLRQDLVYCSWLARAYIRSKRGDPSRAWQLYLLMEDTRDALALLQLVASEFYRAQLFFLAAKAFDVLERLDPDPEYWEAKRGACMGFLQHVALGHEPATAATAARAGDVLELLRASKNTREAHPLVHQLERWVHSLPHTLH